MYNIYVSINDFPSLSTGNTVPVATQLQSWVTENNLTEKVQLFTDHEGNAAAIISEQSITLPSLIHSKQEVGGTNVVYEKVAEGLDAILNLPAEKIAEINQFYEITTRPEKGGVVNGNAVLGRRIN